MALSDCAARMGNATKSPRKPLQRRQKLKRKTSFPRSPTRAAIFLLAGALLISLPGCENADLSAILGQAKALPEPAKRVYIKKVIARVCPRPLTDAERDRAADFVLSHAADLEAVWVAGRLDLADAEAMICRGAPLK